MGAERRLGAGGGGGGTVQVKTAGPLSAVSVVLCCVRRLVQRALSRSLSVLDCLRMQIPIKYLFACLLALVVLFR